MDPPPLDAVGLAVIPAGSVTLSAAAARPAIT